MLDQALAHHQAGRLKEAEALYREILAREPEHADALHLLGVIAHQKGEREKAVSLIEQAIAHNPNVPEYHNNLGGVLHEAGMAAEAIAAYRRAIERKPDYAEAYNNLGNALMMHGKTSEAVAAYREASSLNPDFAEAHYNLGNALHESGALPEAVAAYQKAVSLDPADAEMHNNLGVALVDQGMAAEAIAAFDRALALQPDFAEAHTNKGLALLHDQGKYAPAMAALKRSLELQPDSDLAVANLLYLCYETSTWAELESLQQKLDTLSSNSISAARATGESPFLSVMRSTDAVRSLEVARAWSNRVSQRMANLQVSFPGERDRLPKSRIKLGYLSNDFYDHAMAHLMRSLFALHDRDRFEVLVYSFGADDGSHYRARIEQDADRFIDVRELSYTEAARKINDDRVDILVELKGHTRGNRLEICALRPAPVQVSYLGFPGSTGADFIDYLITDRIVTPLEQARYFSEQLVYLPHCYQVNDHTQPIATTELTRARSGLPEEGFVFCSFNQAYKIEPVMFEVWMRLLRSVPGSVLWLLRQNTLSERNLRHEALAAGVPPEALIFGDPMAKEQHLRRLQLADLVLDTRIYNGHTTTSDALWAGVPVVTLQGDHFASRVSASILQALGLVELVTRSLGDYEALARHLAQHPEELTTLKRKIARQRSSEPLYDTPRFTRNLERAYEQMWRLYQTGEHPRRIEIIDGDHASA